MLAVFAPVHSLAGSQSVLEPASAQAREIAWLSWALLAAGAIIFAIVIGTAIFGLWRGRTGDDRTLSARASRNLVLFGGVVIPAGILLSFVAVSALVGRNVSAGAVGALTIEVAGKLWWWEVRYLDHAGNHVATTANEIHVPAGEPVRFLLRSEGVIHSFWVPNLQGKTDLIPGRTNTSWFRADEPGIYRGQCAEFCGLQHTHMAFFVIVEPPAQFAGWLKRQSRPAKEPQTPGATRGRRVFLAACAECHTIRGTPASARKGPDLTHLASRRTIAAGTLTNSRGNLAGWVADPAGIKPGALMPSMPLPPHDLHALLEYLESLD